MFFYMIRDTVTGLYYKWGTGFDSTWVDQDQASVWTTPAGPSAALGTIRLRNHRMKKTGSFLRPENWKPAKPEVVKIGSRPPEIGFVSCDDWEGLYIDGKLVEQGHHIRIDDIFRHLRIKCQEIHPDDDWLVERGSLPENFEDVKRQQ